MIGCSCKLRVDATRAKEQQALNAHPPGRIHDIDLNPQIVFEEVGRTRCIRKDSTHSSSGQNDDIGSEIAEDRIYYGTVPQINFARTKTNQAFIACPLEPPPKSRPN